MTWDKAHAAVGAMIGTAFVVLLMLVMLGGCGLPSRPPTGNHGQGQSPVAACPGQYRFPVEVDGAEFPLTCFGHTADEVTQFGDETKSPNSAWTELAPLVFQNAAGNLESRPVRVPSFPEYLPYICFALANVRIVQCLYVGSTKYTAHKVEQRPVVLDGVNL